MALPLLAQATEEKPARQLTLPAPEPRLPAGMARADKPEEVAALYSEEHQKRVEAMEKKAPKEPRLTPADAYQLQLIAYRTQLVEEQRQRKIKELELQIEREARLLAEERAAIAERERRRESIYIQHQTVHAYQRRLNDEYWREQRLRQIVHEEHHHHACPSPAQAPASSEGEESGHILP